MNDQPTIIVRQEPRLGPFTVCCSCVSIFVLIIVLMGAYRTIFGG